jgi:hypothetical protein
MLTHVTCPDGVSIPIKECFAGCRLASQFPIGRCAPLPLLQGMFAHEREIKPGIYSTTTLIAPTRATYLRRVGPYAESAEDALWRTWGTAVHHILEDDASEHLAEVRLGEETDADSGGGQLDLYDATTGTLMDLKVTGSFKVEKILKAGALASGEALDWAIQVNRYRQKLEREGFTVNAMVLVLVLRDWCYIQRKKGLPKIQQVRVNKISDRWLDRYFQLKRDALDAAHRDGTCPPCRKREIWGGNRCRGYCPVVEACKAMCEARGEPHPAFGWISSPAEEVA